MGGNRLVLHQRCEEFCQPSLEMLSSDEGDGVSYTSGIVAVLITIVNTLLQVWTQEAKGEGEVRLPPPPEFVFHQQPFSL